jgi:hypothetical protein
MISLVLSVGTEFITSRSSNSNASYIWTWRKFILEKKEIYNILDQEEPDLKNTQVAAVGAQEDEKQARTTEANARNNDPTRRQAPSPETSKKKKRLACFL